jgi:hypothetical protein
VPTNHRRIPVIEDAPLAAALEVAAPLFPGLKPSRLLHELAIKGAAAVVEEQKRAAEQIEALVAFSTERESLIDWDALASVDDAWTS